MIKVTVKETVWGEKNAYETRLTVKDHKDGARAAVFNGVLTIYTVVGNTAEFANAIAGYEPSAWVSWAKVE